MKLKSDGKENKEGNKARKDNGFLSIEQQRPETLKELDGKLPPNYDYLVFRSMTGSTLFSGVIHPSFAKIRDMPEKEHKFFSKIMIKMTADERDNRKVVLFLRFINEADRREFSQIFKQTGNINE